MTPIESLLQLQHFASVKSSHVNILFVPPLIVKQIVKDLSFVFGHYLNKQYTFIFDRGPAGWDLNNGKLYLQQPIPPANSQYTVTSITPVRAKQVFSSINLQSSY